MKPISPLYQFQVDTWIHISSASLEGTVAFHEELFIPIFVNVPMLHCMGHVGSLDQVLNDNGGFTIFALDIAFVCRRIGERCLPSRLSKSLEFLVNNISSENFKVFQESVSDENMKKATVSDNTSTHQC